MRKPFLLAAATLVCGGMLAQKPILYDTYSISGGLMGGANFSSFNTKSDVTNAVNYSTGTAPFGGLWVEFPIGRWLAFEPEVLYSQYRYTGNSFGFFSDAKVNYIQVPLLLKAFVSPHIAITAGPQIDFLAGVNDKLNVNDKDDLKSTSMSISAGVEFLARKPITLFGRYVHGLSNMDNTGNPNTVVEYFNKNFQVGAKVRLFGKMTPADRDGDGVPDKDDKCPTVVGTVKYQGCPVPDTDSDGLNDEQDKCPTVAGTAKYQGCPVPDTDNDGLNDEQDKCPTVAGTAKYQGCPVPDTDNDGLNDEQDKCPTQAGTAKYEGCPVPDTDGDGLNDEQDKCPSEAGPASNGGCPVPKPVTVENYTPHEVTFASGSAVLTAPGKKELDLLVAFMERNPDQRIRLIGHTDNTGSDKINNPLSVKRAVSAKAYLESKGVDGSRVETDGKGSKAPVASNKTNSGRLKNRRIDLDIL